MSEMDLGEPAPRQSKAALRSRVRTQRKALEYPLGPDIADGYAEAVLGDPAVREALSVRRPPLALVYVAARGEPPTDVLRSHLRAQGVEVWVPWALPDRQLRWLPDDGAAQPWGLPGIGEPVETGAAVESEAILAKEPSLVIVPALAATRAGARLGQGGGYYDTLLSTSRSWAAGGPLRAALLWPWEVLTELPVDRHDQSVDVVVSYSPT